MLRKALLAATLALLLPSLLLAPPAAGLPVLLSAAYTVVLKDGRRIEARSRYLVYKGMVRFTGLDGRAYQFPLTEVNLLATNEANRTADKPKRKVWTNDDLQHLKPGAPISVMGGAQPAASATGEPGEAAAAEGAAESAPDPEDTREYWQERLKPLREELAKIDQQLRQFRTGRGQATSNVIDINTNAEGIGVADALQRLERRRTEIQQEITALQTEARRKGVPPGYVR
jgi:hypothetical protein